MKYFVYIIKSKTTGEKYIGQTSDIQRRLNQHNDFSCYFTLHTKRRKGPWEIVYFETYDSRKEAMNRERFFKSGAGRRWLNEKIEVSNNII